MKIKTSKGITLIALVITIIVLLILAGVTIMTLAGPDGILSKAQSAKIQNDKANIREQIELAVLAARLNDKNDANIDVRKLERELTNLKTNKVIDSFEKGAENSGILYTVTKGNYIFEIDEDGVVSDKKAAIVVSGLIVKNGDTVLTENCKSVALNTPLTISFDANISEGSITSIEPNVPYTTDGTKTSQDFEIVGKSKDGETITKTYTVNLKGYYNIPELQVGDYVNYTPNTPRSEDVTALNSDITTYSGSRSNKGFNQDTALKWRVLEIDETTGNPTKLISYKSIGTLYLSGADGYNNSVYLLNKICKTLYSSEKGEARSLTIEDIEAHLNDVGKAERDTYDTGTLTYGQTIRYTGGYAQFPTIVANENKMGINTMPLDSENKNPLKTDGLDLSEQDKTYTGSDTASNGITVTQTYWYNKNKYESEIYTDSIYKTLFHKSESSWLASRCVDPRSDFCNFRVYYVDDSYVNADYMFYSLGGTGSSSYAVRPVVSLKSGVQAEYAGKYNNINSWNI